jgi:Arc/MetJ family transcription regulator
MRTNIVLDDKLVEEARRLTGIKTKKALIHEALRVMIRLRQQGEVRKLRGKLQWVGNLEEQRQARFQDEQ